MRTPHGTKVMLALLVLSIIGVLLSGYMLVLHYQTGPSFCAVGTVVNCDTVNKGPYGELAGFPVALIGLLGYIAIAICALWRHREDDNRALWGLRILASLGWLFSLWLLYLELFVILAVCPFCMSSLILITIITGLAWGACPVPNCESSGSGAGVEPSNTVIEDIHH